MGAKFKNLQRLQRFLVNGGNCLCTIVNVMTALCLLYLFIDNLHSLRYKFSSPIRTTNLITFNFNYHINTVKMIHSKPRLSIF